MNELPKGWGVASLGEVCIQPEQHVPKEDENFIYIDIASIDRDAKRVLEPQKLAGKDAPSRARKLVAAGDVIVSMTRPNLNAVALIYDNHHGCIASTGFDVLRPVEVDPRWIFAAVRSSSFISAMCEKVQGALYPAVKAADIREYEIPIPPLAEQVRITQKLDELLVQVDTLKARIEAIPTLLKRFRQSVLAAAVSGKLTEEWRMGRTSSEGHSSLHVMQLNDESLVIPSLWREETLGRVINPQRKLCYGVVQPGEEVFQGVDLIRVCDIQDGEICWSNLRKIDYSVDIEYRRSRVEDGDIVLSIVGSIGRAAMVRSDKQVNIARAVARISVDKSVMLPGWAYLWISAPLVQWWLVSSSKEVARKTLNLKELIELPIPVPCLEEQTEIVRRAEQLFSFADQLEAKVASAKSHIDHLTQSILAKAFRGELVPQDPSDEPASVLLERIRSQRAAQPKARHGRKSAATN